MQAAKNPSAFVKKRKKVTPLPPSSAPKFKNETQTPIKPQNNKRQIIELPKDKAKACENLLRADNAALISLPNLQPEIEEMSTKQQDDEFTLKIKSQKSLSLWILKMEQRNVFRTSKRKRTNYDDENGEDDFELSSGHGFYVDRGFRETGSGAMTLICIHALSKRGTKAVVEVANFWAHMYAEVPESFLEILRRHPSGLDLLKDLLESKLAERERKTSDSRGHRGSSGCLIVGLDLVQAQDALFFRGIDSKSWFLHIQVATSSLIPAVREIMYRKGLFLEDCLPLLSAAYNEAHFYELSSAEGQIEFVPTASVLNKLSLISRLKFGLIENHPDFKFDAVLCCSLEAYRRLRLRFNISETCALRFLNKFLATKSIHGKTYEAVSWPEFCDKDADVVTNPHTLCVRLKKTEDFAGGKSPPSKAAEVEFEPDVVWGPLADACARKPGQPIIPCVWMPDPQLRRDILNFKALVFRLDSALERKVAQLASPAHGWLMSEIELLLIDHVLGSDAVEEVKSSTLYQFRWLVVVLNRNFQEKFVSRQGQFGQPVTTKLGYNFKVFECDVNFCLRFLVDKQLTGCSWFQIPEESYQATFVPLLAGEEADTARRDKGHWVIQVDARSLQPDKELNESRMLPLLTVLSFDIECKSSNGHFPTPEHNPVIAIGASIMQGCGGVGSSLPVTHTWCGCIGSVEFDKESCQKEQIGASLQLQAFPYEEKVREEFAIQLDELKALWSEVTTQTNSLDSMQEEGKLLRSALPDFFDRARMTRDRSAFLKRALNKIVRVTGNALMQGFTARFSKVLEKVLIRLEQEHKNAEKQLLRCFVALVQRVDPDIMIGWNILMFDVRYLLRRALTLEVPELFALGRNWKCANLEMSVYQTRAVGQQKRALASISGRVLIDGMTVFRAQEKMSSYTLGSVSTEVLKVTKLDIHHSQIHVLADGTPTMRRKLMMYLERDCVLPLQLFSKRQKLSNTIQLSCVCGCPIEDINNRGQSIRTKFLLLVKFKKRGMLMPFLQSRKKRVDPDTEDIQALECSEDQGDESAVDKNRNQYGGATVLPPARGFFDHPMATLDFNSLYPSIMRAQNICYSTLLRDNHVGKLSAPVGREQVYLYDVGKGILACFVRETVYVGVIPDIQTEMTEKRKAVKKEMQIAEARLATAKAAKDTKEIQDIETVLPNMDSQQLAIKVCSNSIYGYPTGYDFREVLLSAAVTFVGRQSILLAKTTVEKEFCKANGYAYDSRIVYGDTDSIFVVFGDKDLKTCIEHALKAQDCIAKVLKPPLFCEFEKIYKVAILHNKKRSSYCKLESFKDFLKTGKAEFKIKSSGLEDVRRDNCIYVRKCLTEANQILMSGEPDAVAKTIAHLQEKSLALLSGEVDLSELVFSANYGKLEYKVKSPAIAVAEKRRKRDPETAPMPGDRVKFTFIESGFGSKQRAFEVAEDPRHVVDMDLPLAYKHIFEAKFVPCMTRFMRAVLMPPGTVVPEEKKERDKVFKDLDDIVHKRIFQPLTTLQASRLVIHKRLPKSNTLYKFVTSQTRCVTPKCHNPLISSRERELLVCALCDAEPGRTEASRTLFCNRVKDLKQKAEELWNTCRKCDGLLLAEVGCSNDDCRIFYSRVTARKEAQRLTLVAQSGGLDFREQEERELF